jgi:hypothetical protein
MPLQRQATQIVIEVTRSQDITKCDGNTAHQRYHVGMRYRKACYDRAPFFAGFQSCTVTGRPLFRIYDKIFVLVYFLQKMWYVSGNS